MGWLKRTRSQQSGTSQKGKRTARHYQHTMVRGVIDGWFVCRRCGLVAVCPGCVESVPPDMSLHLCEEHFHLQVGVQVVWTTNV